MADQFDPTQLGAVAVEEPPPFDPTQHGAIPVDTPQTNTAVAETPKQGGVVSGILSGLGQALNPINLVKGALDIGQPSDISQIYKYGKTLGEIVTGKSPDEAIGKNIPELQQQREAVYGKLGGREQAKALTGIGLQLGLTALPFLHGETLPRAPGSLSEVAGIPKPEVAPETVTPIPTEPVATDAVTAETHAESVAPEVAQPVTAAESVATAPLLPKESLPVAPNLPTGTGETQVSPTVDDVVSKYVKTGVKADEPPIKGKVFRVMSQDEWNHVAQGGENWSGGFWSSDPSEYSGHLREGDVLSVAPTYGPVQYQGLPKPDLIEAGRQHYNNTERRNLNEISEAYQVQNGKLVKIHEQPPSVQEAPVSTTATPLTQTERSISGNKTPVAQTTDVGTGGTRVPSFAAKYDPETFLNPPRWTDENPVLQKTLFDVARSKDAFMGKDITGAWNKMDSGQRQDLIERGWSVTTDRNNKIVLTISGDAVPTRNYFRMQDKAPSVPVEGQAPTAPLSTQTGEPNDVQEPSTGEILQRQPQETGTPGSVGGGVEQGVQGEKPAETLQTTTPQEQVARPEPEVSTFSVETPKDAFGTEQTPVANFLMSGDGVMSKSTAKRNGLYQKNPALWENAPQLSHPTHGKIYPSTTTAVLDKTGKPTGKFRSVGEGGETPDKAAQALYKRGLIADPYPDTMWNALDKESKSARSTLKSQQGQVKDIQKQAGQAKDFGQAQHDSWKQGEPVVQVKDLQVGDTVTVKGQELKVTDIDPDNFDVTLEDGKKYGVQTVKDNTVIYGEHEPITPVQKAPKLLAGENQGDLLSSTQSEPFALAGEKGTDFGAQQAAAEKAQVERAQSEKGQTDLFKPQEIPKDATATVQFKDTNGNPVQKKMNARDAEGIFTKERSSYKALLDCLGA